VRPKNEGPAAIVVLEAKLRALAELRATVDSMPTIEREDLSA
jgi:hypothetical protein